MRLWWDCNETFLYKSHHFSTFQLIHSLILMRLIWDLSIIISTQIHFYHKSINNFHRPLYDIFTKYTFLLLREHIKPILYHYITTTPYLPYKTLCLQSFYFLGKSIALFSFNNIRTSFLLSLNDQNGLSPTHITKRAVLLCGLQSIIPKFLFVSRASRGTIFDGVSVRLRKVVSSAFLYKKLPSARWWHIPNPLE